MTAEEAKAEIERLRVLAKKTQKPLDYKTILWLSRFIAPILMLTLLSCQSRPVIEPSLEDVILTKADWKWFRDRFYDKPLTNKLNEQ